MEFGIPLLSVTMLISITCFITFEAIHVILGNRSDNGAVNVVIIYAFCAFNFIVDFACIALFLMRGNGALYELVTDSTHHSSQHDALNDGRARSSSKEENALSPIKVENNNIVAVSGTDSEVGIKRNMNMMSALFHIGGDTLRTFAILGAALYASFTDGPSNEICDAWAAILVSVTVLFLVTPLLLEIFGGIAKFAFSDSNNNQANADLKSIPLNNIFI